MNFSKPKPDTTQTYRAGWLLPISSPPIKDARITVVGGVVAKVESFSANAGNASVIDLGNVAMMPRFVNAHTHLEFSDCSEPIGAPGIALADWIGEVIRARGVSDETSRQAAIAKGVQESADAGVGLIGDIATTPSAYPDSIDPLIVSFAEVLGLSLDRHRERLAGAATHHQALQASSNVFSAISPHSPYSTPPDVIAECSRRANQHGVPLAIHLAESPDERELLDHASGPFAASLRRAGVWREGIFPYTDDSIPSILETLAPAPAVLLIHGNDLSEREIEIISQHRQMSVVYCPRTHHFFGHDRHPVADLLRSGVRVALGTDSRASNADLSIWEEVRFLLQNRQDIDPQQVLAMATLMGAEALMFGSPRAVSSRLQKRAIGQLVPGKTRFDSLLMVPTAGKQLDSVFADFSATETSQLKFCSANRPSDGHNTDN
ncbi:amidohydrolase family protein [Roseiconus lacunae]|uniref:amidohydrolase family protein n=1 Tax=Roseiconus lacunae TaxID=2605694 RepID=UPI001E5C47F5|nr:amidohydrolase family protein [Roseiconus lacunae]MCD0460836.1 amidohydrolase family protein [Roseiconus lacunae]